jgi:ACS family hexuronate transporter-like MFS transporter
VLTPLVVLGLMHRSGNNWRLPFMAIGLIGTLWVFLWLASVRTTDLAMPSKVFGPSLMGVLIVLIALMAGDFLVHWYLGAIAWAPLASKVTVTILGIAAIFSWLLQVTRGDTPHARAIFLRRLGVLAVMVVAINLTWHFFRAWMPLFLRNQHGLTLDEFSWFSMGYYLATDAGSLTAGFLTLRLARGGLSVHHSRVAVFGCCALLATLSLLVPFLPTGAMLAVTLLVLGFACLGLFPNYYSFSQELSAEHQGKVSGALGCICWLSMALLHEVVGDTVRRTGSYTYAMAVAGLMPLLALVILLLFWDRGVARELAADHDTQPSSASPPGPITEPAARPDALPTREPVPIQAVLDGADHGERRCTA